MEASQAGLKEGFTLYVATQGTDPHDAEFWPLAPLRTETGSQLYYSASDTEPGQVTAPIPEGWAVYDPTVHGAAVPAEVPAAADPTRASDAPAADATPADAPATDPASSGSEQADDGDPSEHAPAATQNEKVIVGDAGLGEQQPSGGFTSQDVPVVNASPPQAQSGVPLAEDRAAGVQADEAMRGQVAPGAGEQA